MSILPAGSAVRPVAGELIRYTQAGPSPRGLEAQRHRHFRRTAVSGQDGASSDHDHFRPFM